MAISTKKSLDSEPRENVHGINMEMVEIEDITIEEKNNAGKDFDRGAKGANQSSIQSKIISHNSHPEIAQRSNHSKHSSEAS